MLSRFARVFAGALACSVSLFGAAAFAQTETTLPPDQTPPEVITPEKVQGVDETPAPAAPVTPDQTAPEGTTSLPPPVILEEEGAAVRVKEREELLYMHLWVRGMLARHELYVARYYLNRDNFEAALSRTEYALRNYRETGLEPEALVLLGETQMRRGERGAARAAFELVVNQYPTSPFVATARNFIAEIERDPAGPKMATPTTPHY